MSSDGTGQSLELYFINGTPDGMLTAEIFNWTGHVLVTPRTQLVDALARKEARYTGVYLLLGENLSSATAYIGESEDMAARLRNHESGKDWWTKAILVTSQANSLNKAHIRYLESRLIEIASEIGRTRLDNATIPGRPSLKESEKANMEGFLAYMLMVLPAIGVDMFKNTTRDDIDTHHHDHPSAPIFVLENRKHNIKARAIIEGGEFIVLKDSRARKIWSEKSEGASYSGLHAELAQSGVMTSVGAHLVFQKNYAFSSPSAAGAVVNGRPSNGTVEWKLERNGNTYKTWEAERLRLSERENN